MNVSINKEEKNQVAKTVFKSILGFIPGAHIVDELTEYRANVQQDRLNKFSEFLKEGFEQVTEESFEPENLKSELFIDAFEIIIRRVASTNSEAKLKSYKNILLKAMYQKTEAEMFFKYINLVDEISETQVLILSSLSKQWGLGKSDIMQYLSNPNKPYDFLINLINRDEFTLFNGQSITTSEVNFYIHELKSKGIISEVPDEPEEIQHGSKTNSKSNERYVLSPIGQ